MKMKELEQKREDAKISAKHYADLILDHINQATFTGKELLDLIDSRKDGGIWDTDPYKIFINLIMEIIRERESEED